jgi:hypothetical protein
MTKKDFNELAQQLAIVRREMMAHTEDSEAARTIADATWNRCVYAVMLACKSTSANFDRGRFLTACGIPNIGVK